MAFSTPYPLLRSDHKVLGSEFCSGYSDAFGKWNTGFYCPQSESKRAISCCGTPTYKYCCTETDHSEGDAEELVVNHALETPLTIGVLGGATIVLFFIFLGTCYFCSCCLFYKKRRGHLPGGLYRIPLASSSTSSALLNTYSNTSNISNNLPLVGNGWAHFPHNLNNLGNNCATNNLSPPTIGSDNFQTNLGNHFLRAQYLQQNLSALNLQAHQHNHINYANHANLPPYFYHHQFQNVPRPSHNSSFIENGTYVGHPPSTNSANASYNRASSPPSYTGFANECSRPYFISNNVNTNNVNTNNENTHNPNTPNSGNRPMDRPRSVITVKNNVAYITSTLPLSNSFTTGGRTLHFRVPEVPSWRGKANVSPPKVQTPSNESTDVLSPSDVLTNLSHPKVLSPTHTSTNLLSGIDDSLHSNQLSKTHNSPAVNLSSTEKSPSHSTKVATDMVVMDTSSQNDTTIDHTLVTSAHPPGCHPTVMTSSALSSTTVSERTQDDATGYELSNGSSGQDLFTQHSTPEPFGSNTEIGEEKVSVKMPLGNAEKASSPTSAALSPAPESEAENEDSCEPHYRVISSSTSNSPSTSTSSVSSIPSKSLSTQKPTIIPLIETHRLVL